MPRVIIFEGADGSGKSTQAHLLARYMKAEFIRQPSNTNLVWFAREEVKRNPNYTFFERQLIHTISHVVDAFMAFDGHDVVMDRSPISAAVYGKLLGLTAEQMNLIIQCNFSVYNYVMARGGYQPTVIHLRNHKSYNVAPAADVYEQKLQSDLLRIAYDQYFQEAVDKPEMIFRNVKVHTFHLTGQESISDLHSTIIRRLGI